MEAEKPEEGQEHCFVQSSSVSCNEKSNLYWCKRDGVQKIWEKPIAGLGGIFHTASKIHIEIQFLEQKM